MILSTVFLLAVQATQPGHFQKQDDGGFEVRGLTGARTIDADGTLTMRIDGRLVRLRFDRPVPKSTRLGTDGHVRFDAINPGIDLDYYARGADLEFDLHIRPGADPEAVRFRIDGADRVWIEDGHLHMRVGGQMLRWRQPVAFQRTGDVPVRFRTAADGAFAFEVGAYDRSALLTIDPVLEDALPLASIGCGQLSWCHLLTRDGAGNLYVAAPAPVAPTSTSFGSIPDAIVTKFSPTGTAIWEVRFGGVGVEIISGIAVDATGQVVVVGRTNSPDFPALNPIATYTGSAYHGFATKLNAAGTQLVYSTVFGGDRTEAFDVAVTAAGNAIVVGQTSSNDFPITGNALRSTRDGNDGFVVELSPTGAVAYGTYFGGDQTGVTTVGVGPNNTVAVAGFTTSPNFVTTPGAYQPTPASGSPSAGFVAMFNTTRALQYSTLYGIGDFPELTDIAITSAGLATVSGRLLGVLRPFVFRLNATGTALVYETELHVTYGEATGVDLDTAGNAYVAGYSGPAVPPPSDLIESLQVYAYQESAGFLAAVDNAGTLIYNTVLTSGTLDVGSATTDLNVPQGIAVEPNGTVWMVGSAGAEDFPFTVAGTGNAFLVRVSNPGTTTDVGITMTDLQDPAYVDGTIVYRLVATNHSTTVTTGVLVRHVMVGGNVDYLNLGSTQGTCAISQTSVAPSAYCRIGTLAPGATATVTVTMDPISTGNVEARATVGSEIGDTNLTNNEASEFTIVIPGSPPDSGVQPDAGPTDAMPGDATPRDAMAGDAMTTDAMPGDAMTTDAMPGDAMTTDAMAMDANVPDSGGMDAMTMDGTIPDSGGLDATVPPNDAGGVDASTPPRDAGPARDAGMSSVGSGCSDDFDCKEDRVCEMGVCVEPASSCSCSTTERSATASMMWFGLLPLLMSVARRRRTEGKSS